MRRTQKRSGKSLAFLLLIPTLLSAQAQRSGWFSPDRFTVRQNLDKAQIPQPGFLQFFHPAGDTAYRVIGLGLRYSLGLGGAWDGGPFAEILQNTLSKKRQDAVRYGASFQWMPIDISGISQILDRKAKVPLWTPLWTGRIGEKADRLKHTTSLQANVFFTPVFRSVRDADGRNWRHAYWPNVTTTIPIGQTSLVDFIYSPTVGIESEFARASQLDPQNRVGRLSTDFALEIYPVAKLLDSRLFLRADHQFRYDFARSGLTGSRSHGWFSGSGGYYFVGNAAGKQAAGIELNYSHGANPDESLQQQEVTSVRLVLRRTS